MISSTTFILIGFAILLGSSSIIYAFGRGYGIRKEGFLLSFRNLSPVIAAISIGMAWAGLPAFFIASGQAFGTGLVGLFWFTIGNILTLMVFAFAAQKIRQTVPEGYNLSDFIRKQYGNLSSKVYTCAALIINYVTVCVTMVAVVFFVNALSGIDKLWISLAIIGVSLTLSFRTGFRATVITEVIKFALILLGFGSIVVMLALNPDIKSFTDGLGGVKGTGADIFGTTSAWTVFATFGVITFFAQMSAPWADNNFSQRAFAFGGDQSKIWISYVLGAIFFSIIPIMTGLIGFWGVANGIVPTNPQYAIVNIINNLAGYTALLMFCITVLVTGISIIDSQLSCAASLIRNEFITNQYIKEESGLMWTRVGMLILCLAGIITTNWPGISLNYVFLTAACCRLPMGLLTALLVFKPTWFNGKAISMIIPLGIAMALFGYSYIEYTGDKSWTLPLVLGCVFLPPMISAGLSRIVK
jgi:Na+/proline symporter